MKISIALDWTPNVLHAGLLIAEAKGWFADAGIDLELLSVEADNYCAKPVEKVLNGEAHLCIGPTEHLFQYGQDAAGKPQLKAVATMMQKDMSAFATLHSSGIDRPAMLSEKRYLAYNTPLETEILKAMMEFDGGEALLEVVEPGRLQVWDAFLAGEGDVCWIFKTWEAALAARKGVKLNLFTPGDFGVPYGYTSLLMAQANLTAELKSTLKTTLEVAARGYAFLVEDIEASIQLLCQNPRHANFEDSNLVSLGLHIMSPAVLHSSGYWGKMDMSRFEDYAAFLARFPDKAKVPANVGQLVDVEMV